MEKPLDLGEPWGTEKIRPEELTARWIVAEACRAVVGFCSLHEINTQSQGISRSEVGKSTKVFCNILYIFVYCSWMQLKAWDSTFKIVKNVEICGICFLVSKMFQDVPSFGIEACCFTRPRSLALRKFAASPAVVVLCGMAAGAGFGSLENVQYIAKVGRWGRFGGQDSFWSPKNGYCTHWMILKYS